MAMRTITGNLAADPEVVDAGSIQITKLRVIENTGEYRSGKFVEHETPTTHFVEAKFELGANAAATLTKGAAVIVVGREHTQSWGDDGDRKFGRILTAEHIGPDLVNATADVTRTPRNE